MTAALPGYKLGHPMGAGSYGMVITARHRRMRREVAIKMVAGEPSAESSFAAEAAILAGLDHPHIVRVFDYQETDGLGLIVMELLTGGTLTRRRRDLTQQQACAVGLAVAAALSHAHAGGVLHRDIKPDNVLFDAQGCIKVADFGIARMFDGTGTAQLGTPMYMAPEQITGGRLGPATDLYALGVLLYTLLAGSPPFEVSSVIPLMWQQTLATVPAPPAGVAGPVAEVVLRALAKAPADRPRDADTFALELAAAAVTVHGPDWLATTGMPLHLTDEVRAVAVPPKPVATTPGEFPPSDPGPWSALHRGLAHMRSRWALGGAGVTALLVVVVVAWAMASGRGSDSPPISSVSPGFTAAPVQTPQPSPTPPAASAQRPAGREPVVVLNSSRVRGLADSAARQVSAAGFPVARTGNYISTYNVEVPTVFYEDAHRGAAEALMAAIPAIKKIVPRSETQIAVPDPLILVITRDFPVDP